jgi:mRNA interferase YafQ
MTLTVKIDKKFKKDTQRDKQSGKYKSKDFDELKLVIDSLIEQQDLDDKYLPHKLLGEWMNYMECHIKPNWLLIYKTEASLVKFARLGTHQQLFKKF